MAFRAVANSPSNRSSWVWSSSSLSNRWVRNILMVFATSRRLKSKLCYCIKLWITSTPWNNIKPCVKNRTLSKLRQRKSKPYHSVIFSAMYWCIGWMHRSTDFWVPWGKRAMTVMRGSSGKLTKCRRVSEKMTYTLGTRGSGTVKQGTFLSKLLSSASLENWLRCLSH